MTDPNLPMPPPPEDNPGLPFPVVGIGASAGGLEAVTSLLENLPADPGLAILFVMHLDRHFKSNLPEILARSTSLPVREATDGLAIEANHIYTGPASASMTLADGTIALSPRPPRGVQMPIDHLFRSLANCQKSRAIGVLLSGEGTDGALGFQTIKAEGGITLAQDARSARHDSMPRSVVVDGSADYVLPPEQIAKELVRVARHSYAIAPAGAGVERTAAGQAIEQVLALVRANTNVDFTHYKRTTIQRRIQRRMALRNLENPDDYLAILRKDPTELLGLYRDLLIRVTQFFRDPEAFEALKEKVFPALVEKRPTGSPIRLWVAGCATGEEVYSLAIALMEFLASRGDSYPVKILATDLNEDALDKARAGVYLDNIEIDVSSERLRRFFNRSEGHYLISKAIREQCVFSRHNMACDPPFSRLDLVSCRNVLIYMDGALQRRVLPVLHYALNPGGFLFLGASENIGPFSELFTPVDARNRLFRKVQTSNTLPLDFSTPLTAEDHARGARAEPRATLWSAVDVQREADRIALARYAPVGVVIDETFTVLQFRGRTSAYLEPSPGMASLDLLRMLREGLLVEVRLAINQAKAENGPVRREGLRLTEGARSRLVQVEVVPFKAPPAGVRFFLVLFQDMPTSAEPRPPSTPEAAEPQSVSAEQQAARLQQELAALRDYLQSVIEDQEGTNEELKSANEEILSANEELQSTNEELQTAKEEAQSANEELATVNEELRHRNTELARVNNDLVNLLGGVNIPVVMVGRDLRIRRFTPLAEKVFNLIPTDLGRPISDIKTNLKNLDLTQLIAGVIDSLTPHESEAQDAEGRRYVLRIRPYVTLDNKIDGASVVLLDIDSIIGVLGRSSSGAARGSSPSAPAPAVPPGEGPSAS